MEISGVDSSKQRMSYTICYLKEEEKLQKKREEESRHGGGAQNAQMLLAVNCWSASRRTK